MSEIHNNQPVNKQVNNPVIQGDLVMYGERAVPRLLTKVPRLRERLIGREEELQQLDKQLKASGRMVLMNGMGGVGKTSLATAYVDQVRSGLTHFVWIEQAGEFPQSVLADQLLLKNLGVALSDDPEHDAITTLNRLANLGGPSLLVIDNAEEDINKYLDHLPGGNDWQVVVTSRNKLDISSKLGVENLSTEEALNLFFEHYHLDQDAETGAKIIEELDRHTLTIELLAKTSQARKIRPLAKVYGILQERGLAIDRQAGLAVSHSKGDKIEKLFPYLLAIFDLTKVSDKEQLLLKQFIFLPPIYISFDLLTQLLQKSDDDDDEGWDNFTIGLDSLVAKGWLSYDIDLGYKMHRVVHEVCTHRLKAETKFEEIETLISGVDDVISYDQNTDNPVDRFPFLLFAETLDRALLDKWGIKEKVYSFHDSLGTLLKDLGQYRKAVIYKEKVLAKSIENGDKNLSPCKSNLAGVYKDLGRYEEAAKLLEGALAYDQEHFGDEHPATAARKSNLAVVYQDLGRYEEAAKLLEGVLAYDQEHFGEKHPSTARSKSNLAGVYQDLGRYEEAAKLLEGALAYDQEHFGDEHPVTAASKSNLAGVYKNLGRYEEAAKLMEGALASDQEHFGEKHPSTTRRKSNLAGVYQDLGRYEETAKLMEGALASDQEHFGEKHPSTARSKSGLALVYRALGRYEEATQLLEGALASDQEHFGEKHPSTSRSKSNLALVYRDLGRYKEAAKLLEGALAYDQEHFGEKHPSTARSKSNLAGVYQDLGRYEEAVKLYQETYECCLEILGEDHPNTKIVLGNINSLKGLMG
jgi:tetratricopeptide (TPR) repeat protein